jgi:hypothetical protein
MGMSGFFFVSWIGQKAKDDLYFYVINPYGLIAQRGMQP